MRLLRTSITVRNIDESLRFYTELLGLGADGRRVLPENLAEIALVRDPESGARIELTRWDGKDDFEPGEQLDHLAFGVRDRDAALARVRRVGACVAPEPYQLVGGKHRLAFIPDPGDVGIGLIERPTGPG